jgi:1-phosphatidylinositol phosphodiesterase
MKKKLQSGVTMCIALAFFNSCSTPPIEEVIADNAKEVKATVQQSSQLQTSKLTTPTYLLSNWMGALDGKKSLADLVIPGTHESGATVEGRFNCQVLSIDQQLNSGVRFLDIRGRNLFDQLYIHHGVFYQNLTFYDVLNSCQSFLKKNPSETIIMSLKEEYSNTEGELQSREYYTKKNQPYRIGIGFASRSYEATFDMYTKKYPGLFYLADNIPNLETARGKIVLFRRFPAKAIKGINADTGWSDNSESRITNKNSTIRIQDYYKVSDVGYKKRLISKYLDYSNPMEPGCLKLNFCSGYKSIWFFWTEGIPDIAAIAREINPFVKDYFTKNTRVASGIVITDYTQASTNSLMIKTNF